jgi:hypothetical protein
LKKIVKLMDHTCAYNGLTNFECEAQATGNGSCVNMQNLAWKKTREITLVELIFWRVFYLWNRCAVPAQCTVLKTDGESLQQRQRVEPRRLIGDAAFSSANDCEDESTGNTYIFKGDVSRV